MTEIFSITVSPPGTFGFNVKFDISNEKMRVSIPGFATTFSGEMSNDLREALEIWECTENQIEEINQLLKLYYDGKRMGVLMQV